RTRPDIANASQPVARHSHIPWVAVEKTLAYLNATRHLGIMHVRGSSLSLIDFADADYA
ncbi:unnamed protein product, partial [Ascophyllum nodosum]